MVFFMVSHGHYTMGAGDWATVGFWIGLAVILAIEANALWGKTGPITSVKGVIGSSVALTVVMAILANF